MALNLIFMGSPNFAVPILKALQDSRHKVLQVYTQPPKKKDRGQKKSLTPVHEFSLKNSISVRHPDKIDKDEESEFIKKLNPDIIVVAAYGQILSSELLNIKDFKFINVHASLLPRWRGAAPIQRAIMNLDKETGISIMKIVPKLDAGPVLMKSKIKIFKDSNFKKINEQLSELGSKMILDSLELIEKNNDKFTSQIEKEVTYAKKIDKKETKINWNMDAKMVIGKINALSPNPGAWFYYEGSRLKVFKAIEIERHGKPGQIIDKNFSITCAKNAIQILELQKESKKRITVDEFLKGNNLNVGSIIS